MASVARVACGLCPDWCKVALALVLVALVSTGCGDDSSNQLATTGGQETDKNSRKVGTGASALFTGNRKNAAVPVLMYHVIADPPAGAPYPDLYVPKREFKAQMRALSKANYRAVTLDQVYRSWHGGRGLPDRPVVVTFDDGYRSVYKNAWPVLRRLGWRGVLNLELKLTRSVSGMRPAMIKKLIAGGWEVDSHTINHQDLTTLSAAELRTELVESRSQIRQQYGVPANFFCYPSGRFNDTVVAAVRSAGYRGATTTVPGLARRSQPFELSRVRVNGGEGTSALMTKLSGLGLPVESQ